MNTQGSMADKYIHTLLRNNNESSPTMIKWGIKNYSTKGQIHWNNKILDITDEVKKWSDDNFVNIKDMSDIDMYVLSITFPGIMNFKFINYGSYWLMDSADVLKFYDG